METLDTVLTAQAARFALCRLAPEEIVASIGRAMDEGIFVDAFLDLPAASHPTGAQTRAPFLALLAARSIAVPERREAFAWTIAAHMRRLASPDHDARVELASLIEAVYHEPEVRENVTKYLGDAWGLERLIGYHWAFDDLEERPGDISVSGEHGAAAVSALKRLCRDEAARWLREDAR